MYCIHHGSICDVTGKGSFPSRIEGASLYTRSTPGPALYSGGGFLSFLFTADELYCLDLSISLAYTYSSEGASLQYMHSCLVYVVSAAYIALAISCK